MLNRLVMINGESHSINMNEYVYSKLNIHTSEQNITIDAISKESYKNMVEKGRMTNCLFGCSSKIVKEFSINPIKVSKKLIKDNTVFWDTTKF